MFKEEVTQNIYSSWYENIKNKGKGSNLKPIRSLESFSITELAHLKWMIEERTRAIEAGAKIHA